MSPSAAPFPVRSLFQFDGGAGGANLPGAPENSGPVAGNPPTQAPPASAQAKIMEGPEEAPMDAGAQSSGEKKQPLTPGELAMVAATDARLERRRSRKSPAESGSPGEVVGSEGAAAPKAKRAKRASVAAKEPLEVAQGASGSDGKAPPVDTVAAADTPKRKAGPKAKAASCQAKASATPTLLSLEVVAPEPVAAEILSDAAVAAPGAAATATNKTPTPKGKARASPKVKAAPVTAAQRQAKDVAEENSWTWTGKDAVSSSPGASGSATTAALEAASEGVYFGLVPGESESPGEVLESSRPGVKAASKGVYFGRLPPTRPEERAAFDMLVTLYKDTMAVVVERRPGQRKLSLTQHQRSFYLCMQAAIGQRREGGAKKRLAHTVPMQELLGFSAGWANCTFRGDPAIFADPGVPAVLAAPGAPAVLATPSTCSGVDLETPEKNKVPRRALSGGAWRRGMEALKYERQTANMLKLRRRL